MRVIQDVLSGHGGSLVLFKFSVKLSSLSEIQNRCLFPTRSKPRETRSAWFGKGFHFMPDKFHFMTYKFHLMTEPTDIVALWCDLTLLAASD
jgi:hypothetical protein